MKYYEKLAARTSVLQGYAVATYVLLVGFLVTVLLMTAALLHYRRKNLTNEKALHTRSVDRLISLRLSLFCILFDNSRCFQGL